MNTRSNLDALLSCAGVKWLLAANLFCLPFAYVLSGNFNSVGLVPDRFFALIHSGSLIAFVAAISSLFVYQVFHVGVGHFFSNMLFLFVLGPALECGLGTRRFLSLYLLAGAVSGLVFVVFFSGQVLPMIGASGAVSGLVGAALLLNRNQPIATIAGLDWTLEAWHVLLVWVAAQLYFLDAATSAGSPLAAQFLLHLSGVAFGFGFAWMHVRRI